MGKRRSSSRIRLSKQGNTSGNVKKSPANNAVAGSFLLLLSSGDGTPQKQPKIKQSVAAVAVRRGVTLDVVESCKKSLSRCVKEVLLPLQ